MAKSIEGASAVDEAMLTGESLPVEKKPGDTLFAGTVGLNGHIRMRVMATGEATALAQIIAAVARAQNSRAEIQRLGDRVSSVFVPVVVLIALATGLWWALGGEQARQTSLWLQKFLWPAALPASALTAAFIQAAAVLIIACPCAMGLATPVAIMAGTNAAARRGILVRDGVALERAGNINAIVFDKTGTLTEGKPTIAAHEIFLSAPEILKLAAALARRSNHPLSQAVAKLSDEEFALDEFEEVRGAGVKASAECGMWSAEWKMGGVDALKKVGGVEKSHPLTPALSPGEGEGEEGRLPGKSGAIKAENSVLRLGSVRWLREAGVELMPGKAFEKKWSQEGATLLGFAADDKLLAMFAVRDSLKPDAGQVMRRLQRDGLKTYLLTGDNALTAKAIAKQAGIPAENVFAEVRPEEKARFIRQLQEQGLRVAFVGDGINDAPALETADLGIAVSRASDVARAAADMVLLRSDIQAVPEALGLARASLRAIKQNLFWAFFYNAAGIPLAALGFLSPLVCALAMGLSDLVVIGNALRLLRWKLK